MTGVATRLVQGILLISLWVSTPLKAAAEDWTESLASVSPVPRETRLPRTRWEHREEAALWTQSALSALKTHGRALVEMVPRDIEEWCPAYPMGDAHQRRAFWVGFLSALAKHESTWRPRAVGGGGRWYGLLQILPATARGYGCQARSGQALMEGPANLSCAIRIMARTVPRDGVVSSRGRGVAADWGPLVSRRKRLEMMDWMKRQVYCQPLSTVRPRARHVPVLSTREALGVRPLVRPDPEELD
ncbi:MAG: transglycosylase SLT domain-containing protein [Roseovarius sp.]